MFEVMKDAKFKGAVGSSTAKKEVFLYHGILTGFHPNLSTYFGAHCSSHARAAPSAAISLAAGNSKQASTTKLSHTVNTFLLGGKQYLSEAFEGEPHQTNGCRVIWSLGRSLESFNDEVWGLAWIRTTTLNRGRGSATATTTRVPFSEFHFSSVTSLGRHVYNLQF